MAIVVTVLFVALLITILSLPESLAGFFIQWGVLSTVSLVIAACIKVLIS